MIELQHLTKRFATQGGTVVALNDINLTIQDGDIYGIIGMSGAGKSTLVRCINMLERPDEGKVVVNGRQMQELSAAELRAARREITMIFQQFNLLMQRTCLRNIMFPMELAKVPKEKAEARARELLELVGLPDKAEAYPAQLSGGQKQRIAIARALATDPKVLLCDEATSALDPNTTHAILELIRKINKELGITVVIITHQMWSRKSATVWPSWTTAPWWRRARSRRSSAIPPAPPPSGWCILPVPPKPRTCPATSWCALPSAAPRPPTSRWWQASPSSAAPWSPSWAPTPASSTARRWAACCWPCPRTNTPKLRWSTSRTIPALPMRR